MKIFYFGSYSFPVFFRDMGHTVICFTSPDAANHPDDLTFDFLNQPEKFAGFLAQAAERLQPDVVFLLDESKPILFHGLESLALPKIWYAVDTHLHFAWHSHYAPIFSKVFCAQQNRVSLLAQHGADVSWLPLCFWRSVEPVSFSKRDIPVSFIGKLDPAVNPKRIELFDGLKKKGIPMLAESGEFLPVYCRSKIVVNQSVNDDLNYRFFEASGCGALLVTDRLTHSMEDILIPDVDYLVYKSNDVDDLYSKVKWALVNPDETEKMAKRAQEKINKAHLIVHRARYIANQMERLIGLKPEPDDVILSHLSYAYEVCSRLPLPERLSRFYRNRADELADSTLRSGSEGSWHLIVLARKAVDEMLYSKALAYLLKIRELPEEKEFKRIYWTLISLTRLFLGQKSDAALAVQEAVKLFPDDPELARLSVLVRH